jgi:hypothetical protein
MFSWHEKTLRNLCRAAFGVLVALPTCAVLAAVVWCRTPISLEYHRCLLAERLALDVDLEQVSFPLPGVTLYEGVSLTDPETHRPLARCRALRCEADGNASSIVCSHAELLDTGRLDLVAELVARALRRSADEESVVDFEVPQLTLHLSRGLAPQTLTDVHGRLQAGTDQPQASVEFQLAGDEQAEPARFTFLRSAAEGNVGGTLAIETGSVPLPARMVELVFPAWHFVGPGTSLRGRISWQLAADGWTGELNGQITGIDLDAVVSERSGHRLSGTAEVVIEQARAEHGRLIEAAGTIKAGPGYVERSLLAAIAGELKATGNDPSAPGNDLADYDEMNFHFTIDKGGVTLHGLCTQAPGTLLVGHPRAPLLGEPDGPQPLLGLVRLMATSCDLAPADPTAQAVLGMLPVPAPAEVLNDLPQTPQAKIIKNPIRLH